MRRSRSTWIGALAVASAAWLSAGDDDAARVRVVHVPSAALGRTLPVAVVTPAAATEATATTASGTMSSRWPVLYVLHGRGRHHASLLDDDATRAALLDAPFFVVLPQGEDGWYLDSPVDAASRYATWVDEVMDWAESHLPVCTEAAGRGIAGWSMGGYGAVRTAQRRAGEFAFVGSIIGLLDFPRPETLPEGQNYAVPVARFGDEPETWTALNPSMHVARLHGAALTVVVAADAFDRTMNENFVAAAAAADVAIRVHRLEGGHTFDVVRAGLPLVLADAARVLQAERQEP